MATHDSLREHPANSARDAGQMRSVHQLNRFIPYLALLAETSIGRVLCAKVDPADVVQEALVRACENFSQYRGTTEAELATWLRRILMNTCTDIWRRYAIAESRQSDRERSLDMILDQSSQALGKLLIATGTTPSQAALRRELEVLLADALADLSQEHRQVVTLRSLQELSWDEISRQMQRSVGAVRMLWVRALKELQPRIESRLQ